MPEQEQKTFQEKYEESLEKDKQELMKKGFSRKQAEEIIESFS